MKEKMKIHKTVKALGLGLVISILATLAGAALCAALISAETIPFAAEVYCSAAIMLVASFAGAKAAIRKVGEKRLITGVLLGAAYLMGLLSMTALFFDGQYCGAGWTAPVIFSGAIAAAMTGVTDRKRGISRKGKNRHR